MRTPRTRGYRVLPALLVAAALATAGCGQDTVSTVTQVGPVDGTWTLVAGSAPDGDLTLVDGFPVTLSIDGTSFGGKAPCNSYGGTARRDGDGFVPAEVTRTEMACVETAVMALESAYLDALAGVTTARLDGEHLVLAGNGLTLTYRRQPPIPDATVEGTRWLVEGSVEGTGDSASVSSLVGAPFLLLQDGRLTGNAGCADLAGSYTLDGDRLLVTDLELAVPADADCGAVARAQDGDIAHILGEPLTVRVTGRSMRLDGASRGLTLFATTAD